MPLKLNNVRSVQYIFTVIWKTVFSDSNYVQSTGAYMAASRLAIATPPPAYVLSRGIGWQVASLSSYFLILVCFGLALSNLGELDNISRKFLIDTNILSPIIS